MTLNEFETTLAAMEALRKAAMDLGEAERAFTAARPMARDRSWDPPAELDRTSSAMRDAKYALIDAARTFYEIRIASKTLESVR